MKAGDKPLALEIRLPETKWLTGRVVDGDTGKGVTGAYIGYSNTHKTEEMDTAKWSAAVSGAEGRFRIPVAVGPGSIGFRHPVFGYFPPMHGNTSEGKQPTRTQITVPSSEEPKPVTLSLGRGLVIRGTVSDANGKPVAKLSVSIPTDNRSTFTSPDGAFEFAGLSPYQNHILDARGVDGFAIAEILADPTHPAEKTLSKVLQLHLKKGGVIVTGRVLFNGKPRAGVVMKLNHTIGKALPVEPIPGQQGAILDPNHLFPAGEVTTDIEGRYRIGGLTAGELFLFEVADPDKLRDDNWPYQDDGARHWNQTVPDKAEFQLPDVNLISTRQILRGMVVDLKGKPLAGINVSASLAGGGDVARPKSGPPPWIETDGQGRFALSQLPEMPIELMAYKNNPGDTEIKYITRIRPKLNQQDIRIVMDPSLHEKIESLDEPKEKG